MSSNRMCVQSKCTSFVVEEQAHADVTVEGTLLSDSDTTQV